MTLTRTPPWLLMPEIADPGNAPADYAYLFTRDVGGVTTVSYRGSSGPAIDVDTPPIGDGSGGEFINVTRSPYNMGSSGNQYAALQAALDDAANPPTSGASSTVFCPLPSIQVNTGIVVPPGVHLLGTRLAGEGEYAKLFAGANVTNTVTLHDNASISGFNVQANGNAQQSIYVDGHWATVKHCKPQGGSVHAIRNNATGADHWTLSHTRTESGGSTAIIGVYGTGNTIDSNVATGAQAGTPPVLAACSESKFYVGHYTGNNGSAECLRVTGDYNSFTAIVGDTCAGPADGCLGIRGNFNTFYACGMMNVATGSTRPLVAFRPSIGNQIFGLFYVSGGQEGGCSPAVQFLDNSGGVLSNTAGNRALFKGTRVYWSGANMTQSGGQWSNFQPVAGDAIDLVGAAGSAQDYRT